jgi:hypothetical protein
MACVHLNTATALPFLRQWTMSNKIAAQGMM